MPMKNVGGPTMNVTRSRSMRSTASAGSHLAISTVPIPAAPGTHTPFCRPDTWARGAGMSTTSVGVSSCTSIISRALHTRARWVCMTALGWPLDPDVNTTAARSDGPGPATVPTGAAFGGHPRSPGTSSTAPGHAAAGSDGSAITTSASTCASEAWTSARPAERWTAAATAP